MRTQSINSLVTISNSFYEDTQLRHYYEMLSLLVLSPYLMAIDNMMSWNTQTHFLLVLKHYIQPNQLK